MEGSVACASACRGFVGSGDGATAGDDEAGWVAGTSIGRERTNTTAAIVMRAMTMNHHRRLPDPGSELIRDNHIPASSPTHGKMTGPEHDQATPCIPARMILQEV
jgi:hypothetical protein